jgi:drug/metabolite transporter (DMT)-like permease
MIGEALALGSAVAFAFANIAIARGARDASGESAVILAILATALIAGTGFLLVGPARTGGTATLGWAALGWFAVSGMLATVGGRLTLFKSIEYAGVVRASTARRLAPVMALILAWALLGEVISPLAALGMAAIAGGFVLLWQDNRTRLDKDPPARNITLGLVFAGASAALYAFSYIARKLGLDSVPDPYLGAFIGAATGALWYAGRSALSPALRRLVVETLARPNPWQVAAAVCISVGQVAQFAALTHIGVARVTFLNSTEVYISAFLAVFVFRTEPAPSRAVLAAMGLATVGVILVAAG